MKYILTKDKSVVACEDQKIWEMWMRQSRKDNTRIVGNDLINGVIVFTVFMGEKLENDNKSSSAYVMTFETTVFKNNSDGENLYRQVSDSWIGAKSAHAAAMKWATKKFDDVSSDEEKYQPARPLI